MFTVTSTKQKLNSSKPQTKSRAFRVKKKKKVFGWGMMVLASSIKFAKKEQ